jgi:hypothetical protein
MTFFNELKGEYNYDDNDNERSKKIKENDKDYMKLLIDLIDNKTSNKIIIRDSKKEYIVGIIRDLDKFFKDYGDVAERL